MSRTLIINSIPFEIPEPGEQQPWGEGLTEYLTEIANVLNSVNGPSDILESSATINNNVSVATDIPGFFFDTNTVRSFSIRGNIYRKIDTTEYFEEFTFTGLYKGAAGWDTTQQGMSDSGVTFSITSLGQVQYISTNLVGTGYTGLIKYRGVGILAI